MLNTTYLITPLRFPRMSELLLQSKDEMEVPDDADSGWIAAKGTTPFLTRKKTFILESGLQLLRPAQGDSSGHAVFHEEQRLRGMHLFS